MHRFRTPRRISRRPITAGLAAMFAIVAVGMSRPANAQMGEAPGAAEEPEIPHAFFTHMGLPEGVGKFNLRLLGLATRVGGKTDGDVAFHFETGLTKYIGLHIRNDRTIDNEKTEAMFQFAAYVSKDGMSGFAPIIELEIPTKTGASRIGTLVGFTSSLGSKNWAFNQVVHYDPREDMVDASAAMVFKVSRSIFPVLELLGEGGKGQTAAVNGLAGVKVRLSDWLIGGVAFQFPLSKRRDMSSQLAFGPDFEWMR